ncbi:MFS transporter [Rhodospirillum rubrum]|uniref:BCD family MFS transporter n=1 Tax=Rhodospirillum rubrum TaxID=1085 RepID=UPI0019058ED3|nr:BCD family MFS transporter [Rhodospirillum rubrum]MBK1665374.1 MFS transporter [Rhodospirillum rubrum]MBK1677445.1 MFS transporter [Rhodospirillum rubrum]
MNAVVASPGLSWLGIVRLGLVQAALGAIVVLVTSTLNRIMVVELLLPALVPGALVTFHQSLQFLRPRWGWGSDRQGRRTPWIIGGMLVLAAGGILAAVATAWIGSNPTAGLILCVPAFLLIGIGVGACGTSLLAMVAGGVDDRRRAPAATIVWMMMIAGFAITAGTAGPFLDPYTPTRLVGLTAVVAGLAVLVTVLALWGVERRLLAGAAPQTERVKVPFRDALRLVWGEGETRQFAIFIFVSMLAYSAQDLILEPFAGAVFGLTPGESTSLAGIQHGGVFLGMLIVGVAGALGKRSIFGSLKLWTVIGCLTSALALAALVVAARVGGDWPLRETVFALGLTNGLFAIAAVGSMMGLAAKGTAGRTGLRMGLWGAAQAIAGGLGSFLGTAAADLARAVFGSPAPAYASVFGIESVLFVVSAVLAARVGRGLSRREDESGGRLLPQSGRP